MLGLYGIKQPKPVDEKAIVHQAEKYNIPPEDSYILDRSYSSFLPPFDTVKHKEQHKNHNQPLQALYYNKEGQLQSYQINCYAGGFPNPKWNRNGMFTTFPPKQQAPLDTFITVAQQQKYFIPMAETKKIPLGEFDYVVIVYWNRFMGRQSRRLIQLVQANTKLAKDRSVKVIYVNNDNLFVN